MSRNSLACLVIVLLSATQISCDGADELPTEGNQAGRALSPFVLEDEEVEFEGRAGIRQSIEFLTERAALLNERLLATGGKDQRLKDQIHELRRQVDDLRSLLASGEGGLQLASNSFRRPTKTNLTFYGGTLALDVWTATTSSAYLSFFSNIVMDGGFWDMEFGSSTGQTTYYLKSKPWSVECGGAGHDAQALTEHSASDIPYEVGSASHTACGGASGAGDDVDAEFGEGPPSGPGWVCEYFELPEGTYMVFIDGDYEGTVQCSGGPY